MQWTTWHLQPKSNQRFKSKKEVTYDAKSRIPYHGWQIEGSKLHNLQHNITEHNITQYNTTQCLPYHTHTHILTQTNCRYRPHTIITPEL